MLRRDRSIGFLTASERRERVTVQVRSEVSDGHDGYTETWTTQHSRWAARVRALSGRDLETARQVDPRVSWEVILQWWQDFRSDLAGGRTRLVFHPTSDTADDITMEIVGPPVDVEGAGRDVLVYGREVA